MLAGVFLSNSVWSRNLKTRLLRPKLRYCATKKEEEKVVEEEEEEEEKKKKKKRKETRHARGITALFVSPALNVTRNTVHK